MTIAAGARLGSYEILGTLGAGGMGEVYRARDTRLAREVAIKVVPDLFADDADRLARFTREAQTLAALNHPNIAQIHGFEDSGGIRALVMELVEGDDLSTLIARGPIAAGEALPMARQIAEALEAAHELGIVHRDLKPANIKVRRDGTVKVLDFGLAKALLPAGADGLPYDDAGAHGPGPAYSPTLTARATQMGVILGTASYMAPEQAKGKTVDRRADIWAFGVILHEMLTGHRLFDADTIPETLAHVITREIDLTALPPELPPHVRTLIARCLVKDPKQRLRDIGEARLALGVDPTPSVPVAEAISATPVDRSFRRREAAAWTLVALCAIAAALVVWWRPSAPLPPPLRLTIPLDATLTLSGFSIALAPDGHAIAIQAPWRDGDTRLYVRRLDALALEPLPGTEGGHTPFWSPDSRSIGFVSSGQLKRFDLLTSTVRAICAAPELLSGVAWGTGGTILFSAPGGPLHHVQASGGTVSSLEFGPDESAHARPTFLPDGKRFLYVSRRTDGAARMMLGRIDKPDRTPLMNQGDRPVWTDGEWLLFRRGEGLYAQRVNFGTAEVSGDPALVVAEVDTTAWSGTREAVADTGVVAYTQLADRRRQFRWYSRSGGVERSLGSPAEYTTFDLSPDGRRIVTGIRDGTASRLWTIDGLHGSSTRVTIGDNADVDPRWAPDGRSIIFGSTRDPVRSPFRVTPGGDPPTPLFKFAGTLFALDDYSRDGRWVLYHDARLPVLYARAIDAVAQAGSTGEQAVVVARALTGTIDQGAFSPDVKWVAYNSNESGRHDVFVVPFPPTGERYLVSTAGGVQPMWRADGRELYYLAPDATLMAVPIGPGAVFSAGEPRPLFKTDVMAPTAEIEQYAPSADGSRFLMLDFAGDGRTQSVQVLSNWRAVVER